MPEPLQSIGEIDIFHHDSTHSYDLMTFEYETVWPHLKHEGLLLSHDADWNNAFESFCPRHTAGYRIHKGVGTARKPSTSDNS